MEKINNLVFNLKEVLIGRVTRLRYIKRYSICPRVHEESVAEHSFYTAYIALAIGRQINNNHNNAIDMGILLSRALVHDLDEVYSGDFIRMFKHSSPGLKTAIDAASFSFMKEFTKEMGERQSFTDLWLNAKDASLEGAIVGLTDFLSVVSYIAQEIRSGNVVMREQIPELKRFAASFHVGSRYQFLMPYVQTAEEIIDAL